MKEDTFDRFGFPTTTEHLESVLRYLDQGRIDLARSMIESMIGRKISENKA